MKLSVVALRRLHWINLPTVALLALLQRAPVLRVVVTALDATLRDPAASVLKSAAATLGALGAVHTLAGATQLNVASVDQNPRVATVGVSKTIVFDVSGSPAQPGSWTVGGAVPPGMAFARLGGGQGITSGLINAATIQLSGTPTAPGSFTVSLRVWRGTDGTLDNVTYNHTIDVTAAGNTAPGFTTQPAS